MCLYIHAVVLQRGLPSLDGKLERFVTKKWEKRLPNSSQTDYSSYCKMCTLPTLRSRVFVCCEQYKHARSYCWQWKHFIMGPNEQNQHFAELRQKNMFIHTRSSAPNMFAKFEWKTRTFCHKKAAKVIAKLEPDRL